MSLPVIHSEGGAASRMPRVQAPTGDLLAQLGRLAEVARVMVDAEIVLLAEIRWELRGNPQLGESGVAAQSNRLAAARGIDGEFLMRLLVERRARVAGSPIPLTETDLAQLMRLPGGGRGFLVPVDDAMPSAVFLLIGGETEAGRLPDAFRAAVSDMIALYRRAQAWRESADTSREATNRWQWLLSLSADAVWDADDTGRIHSVRPLGDRLSREAQHAMLRHNALHIDGHGALSSVFTTDVNTVTGVQGHIHTGSEKLACRVSAQRVNGSIRGVVTVVEGPDAVRQRHNLLSIIQRLNRVRERERDLRLEAETLLQGLRILTGALPSHKMFAELLELLRAPLVFEAACVVRRDRSGRMEAMTGADAELVACDWNALADRLDCAGATPVMLDMDDGLRAAMGRWWQSVVVARLEVERDAAWLVCVHGEPDHFQPHQLGLLSRLVLLAEQALANEEQRALLMHSSKLASLGEMVASLAHEINQPLGTISLAAQNLSIQLNKPELDRESLLSKAGRIGAQVDRVQAITRRMRDFSRKGQQSHSPFPLHRHLVAAADLVEGRLRRHGIQVVYEVVDEDCQVMGNAEQFEQVMVNVLANAADSVGESRIGLQGPDLLVEPMVSVSYRKTEDGMVEVTVRDTGTGFDAAALAHALEPFFTTKEAGAGTGLGLAVSNSIILDMEGWLRPSNWEGGGQVTIALKSAALE